MKIEKKDELKKCSMRLEESLLEELDAIAKENDVNRSEVVRQILKKAVSDETVETVRERDHVETVEDLIYKKRFDGSDYALFRAAADSETDIDMQLFYGVDVLSNSRFINVCKEAFGEDLLRYADGLTQIQKYILGHFLLEGDSKGVSTPEMCGVTFYAYYTSLDDYLDKFEAYLCKFVDDIRIGNYISFGWRSLLLLSNGEDVKKLPPRI